MVFNSEENGSVTDVNTANVSLKLVEIPVKSMYWSARATLPGGKSAIIVPVEQTDTITSQPDCSSAFIFALWFIICGGLLASPEL